MRKTELKQRSDAAIEQTREAIQTIWDNINKGQQKQLAKREEVKLILDMYGVTYDA